MVDTADSHPVFAWPVRVYWEDTDAGGVVYHAGYLRFLERARSEWLRQAAMGQQRLREEFGILFVVRSLEIDFKLPARLDDLLSVTMRPTALRGASFIAAQEIRREPKDTPLVQARVRIACLGATTFRPQPIPASLLEEMTSQ
ncbi:MAG: tol-pal system-associated acyl-CoA thioesterase [Rhodanobacteraceae bacterium]